MKRYVAVEVRYDADGGMRPDDPGDISCGYDVISITGMAIEPGFRKIRAPAYASVC